MRLVYTRFQSVVVDTEFARPKRKALAFPVVCDYTVVSFVVSLLHAGCPTNVARLVTKIVVDALKGEVRTWASRYLRCEGREVQPAFMNSYAASPIVSPGGAVVPCTALRDVMMHTVEFRRAICALMTMFVIHGLCVPA